MSVRIQEAEFDLGVEITALRTGRKLRWDPARERFEGDRNANAFLAREQRRPWTYDMI